MKDLIVLGIETSCDETSAAVVLNNRRVLSNVTASQINLHKAYGGVVPELASRKHIEALAYIITEALERGGAGLPDITVVGVTVGPGLAGALLVGLSYAKALAFSVDKPLVGVHHIEGHICANYLESNFEPPFICLVVSGGHTNIVNVRDYGEYKVLGSTKDDAAGEAYDKVARALGLSYPGGPALDQAARGVDPEGLEFPRALVQEGNFDFSFSGLKSAVLNHINRLGMLRQKVDIPKTAAAFQRAAVDVLVMKTMAACEAFNIKKAAIAGGVACNEGLRMEMAKACEKRGFVLHIPPPELCLDNGAMIASRAGYRYLEGYRDGWDLNTDPGLSLGKEWKA